MPKMNYRTTNEIVETASPLWAGRAEASETAGADLGRRGVPVRLVQAGEEWQEVKVLFGTVEIARLVEAGVSHLWRYRRASSGASRASAFCRALDESRHSIWPSIRAGRDGWTPCRFEPPVFEGLEFEHVFLPGMEEGPSARRRCERRAARVRGGRPASLHGAHARPQGARDQFERRV